jgi:hypothetical protein
MDINVYDTYVTKKDGTTMHFDVFMPVKDGKKAIESAKKFVESVGEKDAKVTSDQCGFCHVQKATPKQEQEIKKNGYAIVKMDGCPS